MRGPLGASVTDEGVEFSVWAPACKQVELELLEPVSRHVPMSGSSDGVFAGFVPGIRAGQRYKFRLEGGASFADPYSRFQPDGPHGASEVVDARAYRWSDEAWSGVELPGQVIYEVHIGTFTEQGTFVAAAERLPHLVDLGVTLIEVMPVAEFPGRFNWGYDGVNLFAPFHGYGAPDDFRHFVDAAHRAGLGVVLDVVYNHIGPAGNYLPRFSDDYFCKRRSNEWGAPFCVDGPHSGFVRRFLTDNARRWIEEFHLDGLRLDATSAIPDESETHILEEIITEARAAAGARKILLIAEDEQQTASRLLRKEAGGIGLDAMWNDDFHHAAYVAATGRRLGYFYDYRGTAQEFVATAKHGFLYQGQMYAWQKQRRGQRLRADVMHCISFIENHDQVANSLYGHRLHRLTDAGRYRALTAFMLLMPQTPMLFMGQEFNASSPFLYFADHEEGLREQVRQGRREFLAQFLDLGTPTAAQRLDDPAAESTFAKSKLHWQEVDTHSATLNLYKDLIRLRSRDPVLASRARMDGAVLTTDAFVLRWFDERGDRLLLVNLGVDLELSPCPEPLLACSSDAYWETLWSSSHVAYGGTGLVLPETETGWFIPGATAMFLSERALAAAKR